MILTVYGSQFSLWMPDAGGRFQPRFAKENSTSSPREQPRVFVCRAVIALSCIIFWPSSSPPAVDTAHPW